MPGKVVPREQWRARSKKSRVQRLHKQKGHNLAKNLEKVENLQYQKDRLERDRERVGEGRAVAGHHNLPDQILKAAPKAKAVRAAATRPAVRRNMVIGFLNHNNIRKKLQEAFAVEVDE
ncbi:hypothetical protein DIPPA_14815 [Diplonema papillatum]|nr:hypothetical protein DIPPA_14815 [Diplonema papillatum]